MSDSFDALPPYPGVPFSPASAAPAGPGGPGGPGGPPPEPVMSPAPPPTPLGAPAPARRLLWGALGAGAVVLAAGAFLLGRGTAHPTTALSSGTALTAARAASPAGSAGSAGSAGCTVPRRVTAGTLKSVSGSTLTVTTPKGGSVTVKTAATTKVIQVVKASLSDVTVGAVVSVEGPANSTSTIAANRVTVVPAGSEPTTGPRLPGPGPFTPGGAPSAGATPAVVRGAVGTVKSVSGSTITLTAGNTTVTVTTSSSTTYSKIVAGTVKGLTVGQPITVAGAANSDGSITAATIEQGAAGASGPLAPFGLGGPFGGGFGGGFGGFRGRGPAPHPGAGPGPGPGSTLPPATTPTTG